MSRCGLWAHPLIKYFLIHLLPLPSLEHVITASLSIPVHSSSRELCNQRNSSLSILGAPASGYPDGNPGNTQLMPDTQKWMCQASWTRQWTIKSFFPFVVLLTFINMGSVLSLLWTPCITIVSFANLKYMFANLLLHCLAFFIETYYRSSYSIPI